MNHRKSIIGKSRWTRSKILRKRPIDSSYVAWIRQGHRASASFRTMVSSSCSMTGRSSGRGCRKFSKSAALQTRFSPAPLTAKQIASFARPSHAEPTSVISYSCPGFLGEKAICDAHGELAVFFAAFSQRRSPLDSFARRRRHPKTLVMPKRLSSRMYWRVELS